MDIWVKAQNRLEIIKVNDIFIQVLFNDGAIIKVNDGHMVAQYDTVKRCKEVLNEIYNKMKDNVIYTYCIIYEMPLE